MTRIKYQCNYCEKLFDTQLEREEHEIEKHLIDYSLKDNATVVEALRELSNCAYGYNIYNEVCGMPVSNFETLIDTAANRLERYADE